MASNMLRQRKRDINLKPNRTLDKKGSRGMLYENEDLRLRTIHINEEVERGHNDIKKLKKENDHLKREIWGLRDEYEKLEEMLQKVITNTSKPATSGLPGGEHRVYTASDELLFANAQAAFDKFREGLERQQNARYDYYTGEYLYPDEDDPEGRYYYEDDDGGTSFGSSNYIAEGFPSPNANELLQNSDQASTSMSSMTLQGQRDVPGGATTLARHSSFPSPHLEVVKEESEPTAPLQAPPTPLLSPEQGIGHEDYLLLPSYSSVIPPPNYTEGQGGDKSGISEEPEVPPPNPKIEITPAKSPTNTDQSATSRTDLAEGGGDHSEKYSDPGKKKEEGAETVIKSIQETDSKVGHQPESTKELSQSSGIGKDEEIQNWVVQVQDLGMVSQVGATYKVMSEIPVHNNPDGHPPNSGRAFANSDSSQGTGGEHSDFEKRSPSPMISKRRRLGCKNVKQNKYRHSTGPTVRLNRALLANLQRARSNSKCKSEPSYLNFLGGACEMDGEVDFLVRKIREMLLNSSDPKSMGSKSSSESSCWSSVDQNILIGVSSAPGDAFEPDLTAQEVIDAIESQFDPALDMITGVRIVLPGYKLFISLKSASNVKSILEKSQKTPLTLRGRVFRLEEGVKSFSTIILSHIPPELRDTTIISVLNQFGQVVSPLEKLSYKGIDISERIVKMHQIHPIPTLLPIGGFHVRVRGETQVQGQGQPSPIEVHTRVKSVPLPVLTPAPSISSGNPTPHPSPVGGKPPIPPRHLINSSPSPSPLPPPSSPHPSPGNTPKSHRPLAKCVSSMPRLENGGSNGHGPPSGHPYARQMSVSGPHVTLKTPPTPHNNNNNIVTKPIIRSPLQRANTTVPGQHPSLQTNDSKGFTRSQSLNPRGRGGPIQSPHPNMGLRRSISQSQQAEELSQIGKSGLPWCSCFGNGLC